MTRRRTRPRSTGGVAVAPASIQPQRYNESGPNRSEAPSEGVRPQRYYSGQVATEDLFLVDGRVTTSVPADQSAERLTRRGVAVSRRSARVLNDAIRKNR